jgi:DNA polymerase III epsilon subunit-like protein
MEAEVKCLSCGIEFKPDRRTHKCCSEKCQRKYYNHENLESRREWEKKQHESLSDWAVRQCILIRGKGKIKTAQITQEMIQKQRESILEFRLRKCRWDKERKYTREIKHCKICGIELISRNPVYCSDKCRKEKARRDALKSNKIKMLQKTSKDRKCKECGRSFISEYGNKKRTFCCEFCCKKYSMRTAKSTRRARERGNNYESVDPFYVFRRDRWRCQICGTKTPRSLRGTIKDNAPELDHIISLSEGGEHSMRNTQCLCRKCNQYKGANTKGQLRLFG